MKLRHLGFILVAVSWVSFAIMGHQEINNEASIGQSLGVALGYLVVPAIIYYGIFYLYDKLQDRKMDKEIRSAI